MFKKCKCCNHSFKWKALYKFNPICKQCDKKNETSIYTRLILQNFSIAIPLYISLSLKKQYPRDYRVMLIILLIGLLGFVLLPAYNFLIKNENIKIKLINHLIAILIFIGTSIFIFIDLHM